MAEAIQLRVATFFPRPCVFMLLAFYLTAASIVLFQQIDRALAAEPTLDRGVKPIQCGVILYYLILVFNLSMTFDAGEMLRGIIGITGVLLYIPIVWMVFTRYWQWSAAHRYVSRGALL
ncbi:MAG TPA: hypothetical protein VN444_04100 [Verrucomicrobiae bacterium]|nr:hypothetical protein [Verrucomicrobiae bacterium]